MKCKYCGTPIVLVPSAEERARKDMSGRSAAYYRSLFTVCTKCQVDSWYNRGLFAKTPMRC